MVTTPILSPEAKAITDKGASNIHVDTDTDGLNTTSIKNGVKFDIFSTGNPTNIGWGNTEDGLLAIDNNGNGKIDNGTELFGGGVGQGFAKLAALDSNKDGIIDAKDTDFSKLQIWTDLNQDGKTDPGELKSLKDSNVASLNLGYTNDFKTINNGNLYGETSTAGTTNGEKISLVDVYYPVETPAPLANKPLAPIPPGLVDKRPTSTQMFNDFQQALGIGLPSLRDSIGKQIEQISSIGGASNIAEINNHILGDVNSFIGGLPLDGQFQLQSNIFSTQVSH